jgi:hypothetical protein
MLEKEDGMLTKIIEKKNKAKQSKASYHIN